MAQPEVRFFFHGVGAFMTISILILISGFLTERWRAQLRCDLCRDLGPVLLLPALIVYLRLFNLLMRSHHRFQFILGRKLDSRKSTLLRLSLFIGVLFAFTAVELGLVNCCGR